MKCFFNFILTALILAVLIQDGEGHRRRRNKDCTLPPNSWRVKVDLLGMSKQEAKAGFAQAFSTPDNPKFAQRTLLGHDPASFTPLTDDSFSIAQLDGSYTEIFNYTSRSSNCVEMQSQITLYNGAQLNIEPFTGIERNSNGVMSYVIGFESCTSPHLPAGDTNYWCNEAGVGYMLTNAKRYACMIINYHHEDPVSICKDLVAVAPTEPVPLPQP